jgi:hypothetical protein
MDGFDADEDDDDDEEVESDKEMGLDDEDGDEVNSLHLQKLAAEVCCAIFDYQCLLDMYSEKYNQTGN